MRYTIIGSGKIVTAHAPSPVRISKCDIANSRGLTVKKENVGEVTILTPLCDRP